MSEQLKELITFFGKKGFSEKSKKWLKNYSSFEPEYVLLDSFKSVFQEDPFLFEICEDNVRELANEIATDYYRNEAVIKSLFAKTVLNKREVIAGYELPIKDNRLDICAIIEGSSYAFEIKTKYDSTLRLEKQLNTYSKFFENVYVICSSEKTKHILDSIPSSIGIYEYDDGSKRVSFSLIREATKNDYCTDENSIFKKSLVEKYGHSWKAFVHKGKTTGNLDSQAVLRNA